ncbi:hypothetical protein [Rugamonas aquatica]|uniref:Uncharacterized protein n=1 Tax=Rugamonas aquatica TaxID=2743357 RepID=A0A6A7N0Y3_9BURK|nr:hypothetical protein [Rugamonas aquatica]MQA38687.1 hypothetical protein [Rugamonas aquatica]
MTIDSRDAIWNEAQDLLYRASYASELKTALLARWVWLDSVTKVAVAISSGGAALAGLVFWKNSDYAFLWPPRAGETMMHKDDPRRRYEPPNPIPPPPKRPT